MNYKERINQLEEEAQVNLTLFRKGQDKYAITRYQTIMEQIRNLRQYGNDNRS
tara:strand:+ start:439 stop:597 length:159 start_codon:yes stop_codon:yes gene_type:complete